MDVIKISNSDSIDKKISISVLSYFLVLLSQFTIRIISNNMEGEISNLIKIGAVLIQGLLYLYSFIYVCKRKGITIIKMYMFFSILFLINTLIHFENLVFLADVIFPFFFTCLPAYLYVSSIVNFKNFEYIMYKVAELSFFFTIIILISVLFGLGESIEYSMGLSYYLLFSLIIFTEKFIEKYNIIDFIKILTTFILIVLLGSRGPILCFVVYYFLKKYNFKDTLNIRGIASKVFTLFLILVLIFNYRYFLRVIYDFFNNYFNVRSRTIELLINDIYHSSGRDIIYSNMIASIHSHPFFGVGIAGDRAIMGDSALYAHNIILEILVSFGIIIGSVMIVLLLFLITYAIIKSDSKMYNIIIIWICIGFISLLFSESYLREINFWIMLAILIKTSRGKNLYY